MKKTSGNQTLVTHSRRRVRETKKSQEGQILMIKPSQANFEMRAHRTCLTVNIPIFTPFLTFLESEEGMKQDPIKSLSNSFDMPKLEMLENFNNDRPIPTIDNDLRNQINEPISQSNRLSSTKNHFTTGNDI